MWLWFCCWFAALHMLPILTLSLSFLSHLHPAMFCQCYDIHSPQTLRLRYSPLLLFPFSISIQGPFFSFRLKQMCLGLRWELQLGRLSPAAQSNTHKPARTLINGVPLKSSHLSIYNKLFATLGRKHLSPVKVETCARKIKIWWFSFSQTVITSAPWLRAQPWPHQLTSLSGRQT